MIGDPPSLLGGDQLTVIFESTRVTVKFAGVCGRIAEDVGVTLFEGAEGALVPAAFVAVTVKV